LLFLEVCDNMTCYKTCSSINTITALYKNPGFFLLSQQEKWKYIDNAEDKMIILAGGTCG
jgi:hypothetical protein